MSEFKLIQTCVFLIALLHFSAAETKKLSPTAGGNATLPCENVMKNEGNCRGTTWLVSYDGTDATETLVEDGEIHRDAEATSARLGVTANCSLVLRKVTEADAGLYTCRQFNESGIQQKGGDTSVYLSVGRSEDTMTATKPREFDPSTEQHNVCRDRSALDVIMLVLRVAELLLITVITVLLFRAQGVQRQRDDNMVNHHDGDDCRVEYENYGEPSASVRLH